MDITFGSLLASLIKLTTGSKLSNGCTKSTSSLSMASNTDIPLPNGGSVFGT